ncbi:hypothetical protein FJY63_13455 [Candidatus Sumerlaeota bacterium]|nr:hypothetical protein [Candidatus Sumerlaeota bacterium]
MTAGTERSPDEIRAILAQLTELQELDRKIIQVRQQMAALPPRLRAVETRFSQEQRELEKLTGSKSDRSKDQRRLEHESREIEEEIESHKKRLMEVKDNKQYAAVGHEIAVLRQKLDAIETAILKNIEDEEAHERRVAQARQKIERVRAETNEEKRRIEDQIRTRKQALDSLDAKRQHHRQAIPADVLALYDRLFERNPGNVVCQAVGNHCGGCHINLVNQKMLEIRQMKTFVRCEGCLRFFTGLAET